MKKNIIIFLLCSSLFSCYSMEEGKRTAKKISDLSPAAQHLVKKYLESINTSGAKQLQEKPLFSTDQAKNLEDAAQQIKNQNSNFEDTTNINFKLVLKSSLNRKEHVKIFGILEKTYLQLNFTPKL